MAALIGAAAPPTPGALLTWEICLLRPEFGCRQRKSQGATHILGTLASANPGGAEPREDRVEGGLGVPDGGWGEARAAGGSRHPQPTLRTGTDHPVVWGCSPSRGWATLTLIPRELGAKISWD